MVLDMCLKIVFLNPNDSTESFTDDGFNLKPLRISKDMYFFV